MRDQRNNEENQKNEKEDFCDTSSQQRDPGKAKDSGQNRDQQEHQGPIQHFKAPFDDE
jgi:hypothetical protein